MVLNNPARAPSPLLGKLNPILAEPGHLGTDIGASSTKGPGPGAGARVSLAWWQGQGWGKGSGALRVLPQLGDDQFLLEEEKASLAPPVAPGQPHVRAQHRLSVGESLPAEQRAVGMRKAVAEGPGRARPSPSPGGSLPGVPAAVGLAHPARDRRTPRSAPRMWPSWPQRGWEAGCRCREALFGQTLPPPRAAPCQHSPVLPALVAAGSKMADAGSPTESGRGLVLGVLSSMALAVLPRAAQSRAEQRGSTPSLRLLPVVCLLQPGMQFAPNAPGVLCWLQVAQLRVHHHPRALHSCFPAGSPPAHTAPGACSSPGPGLCSSLFPFFNDRKLLAAPFSSLSRSLWLATQPSAAGASPPSHVPSASCLRVCSAPSSGSLNVDRARIMPRRALSQNDQKLRGKIHFCVCVCVCIINMVLLPVIPSSH